MTGAGRVLVIDDEPNILATLAPLLRAHGYEVATAATGRPAVLAVDATNPDLLILDLGLPDLDGVEVCVSVRRRSSDAAPMPTPVLVRGNLLIDRERFCVERDGQGIRLTPKEFELLTLLAAHAAGRPEHLRVLVGTLRKKIEPEPSSPRCILTEPWVGYRFADA